MQPYSQLDTRKNGSSINKQGDDEYINFTFQWATHINFKQHDNVKLNYIIGLIKNNSKYFTNCLIYVKDKSQQEQLKPLIQRETRLLAKCSSSNELLNLEAQFSKKKIFIVSFDGNVTDKCYIPRCFDLVFFISMPKLEDYQKLVRKQIKSQTKSKCGLVISYCYSTVHEKMVTQFVEKAKVKTNTYQQLNKQLTNLSGYFKLEDISIEKKNSQKSQQDIVTSPEVQDKIQPQSLKTTNNIRILNWATYLIVSTEQQYKAGRIFNYIKLCSKLSCCIIYTKTESKAKNVFAKLPLQMQKQTSILLGYPQNYLEYLQKLQQKQLKILMIVTNNQDAQRQSSQFFVPSTVNLIISDNMPTRQTFNQRFGKVKQQANQGGVIVSMLSSYNEIEESRNFFKQNGITVNDQHRKEDYDLDQYLKPSSETLQQKLKKSKSPKKTENLLNKNTENITQKHTANQPRQSKIQESQPPSEKKTAVRRQIGGLHSDHSSQQDPAQTKTEKNQQKLQNFPPLDLQKKVQEKPNSSDNEGNINVEQKQQDGQGQQKSSKAQQQNLVPQVEQNISDNTVVIKIEQVKYEVHQAGNTKKKNETELNNLPQDIAANQDIGQNERKKSEVIKDKEPEQGSVTQQISKKTEQVVQKTGQRAQAEQTVQTEQAEKTEPKEQTGQTGKTENSDKKSQVDPTSTQKKQNPSHPTQPKIEQARQNPIQVEPTNNNKSSTIEIRQLMFQSQKKQKQDTKSSSDAAQKQPMQLSNTLSTKHLQLSDKLEQQLKKIQVSEVRIDSVGSSIKENTGKINQTVTTSSQQVTEPISNGVENLKSILTKSLSDQKTLLQNSLTSITNCIQTETHKSYVKINQVRQDTAQIKIIANEAKQIREQLPSITGSIQSIKQDLIKDMKQLQRITLQLEQTQTSNSQTILSKIGEENNFTNNLIKQTTAQQKNLIDTEFRNINQKQVQIYNKLEQVPGKLQSIERDVKTSLSNQKIQLQESVRIIKTCVEAQNQKNLVKISQILKETSPIKMIADEAKQIREALPCISGSIQSIKQNLTNDIKQLQKINTRVENTQKSNSQTILSKIGEASQLNNKIIKETAAQHQTIINNGFKSINQKQSQIQNKLEQVPGKLQIIYNGTSNKLNQLEIKFEENNKDLQQRLKDQVITNKNSIIQKISADSKNTNSLIIGQNQKIFNYIDTEKKRVATANQNILQDLKTKKQTLESDQKNRIEQFERKLDNKEKTSSNDKLQKKITQLEKKYQDNMAEILTLRTYKVNGVKTSEELDRVRLQLSNSKKIERQFIAYKKKYSIQTATFKEKQKECDQLKSLVATFQLQIQDLVPIRDELNTARQTIYSLIQVKSQKKEPEAGSINNLLMKGATSSVTNNMLVKSMAQISKIPKQAQNMNLPTLIKTYLLAQTRALSDLKPYLSNFVKSFPAKQSDSLLTESKQTKACMSSFQNALKIIDKQSGSAQLINSILRLIGQYDTLKKYQVSISKYSRELQVTFRTLNDKTDQVVTKKIQLTPTKILGSDYKDSVINVDLQEICKNVNRLLTNFNSKSAQLVKANQLIEEFKKQNNVQSNIINGLNTDKNTLTAQLNLAKGQNTKSQTQLTQTQNDLSTMTTSYKKTVSDLAQTKKKLGQTQTKLTQTQTNLKKVMKTLQQTTKKLSSTENALKQTTTQLSINKAALQQKQRQVSAQKQQLATNDSDLSKLRRALLDQKARAKEQADEADKNIQDLRKTITEAGKNYKNLEQKSIRQIKEQKQKSKQQLKNKQDDIAAIKLENENQRAKLLGQMKQFEDSLNESIKTTLKYEPKLTINNFKKQFPQFSKAMMQKHSKSSFLVESSTYRKMSEEDRLFVFDSIKRVVNRKIDYTKTLFQGYSGVNFDQWLFKIYGKPNLLVLITLTNGHIIGGFSENPFSKDKGMKGKGYMMSITNKRIYDIKTKHEGKVAKYDDFMFIFGNNELLIKNNLTFTAIFARQFCYFETGDDKIQDFLGQEQEEGTFKSVEFHQVIFS